MITEQLLENANKRYRTKNKINENDFDLSIMDFILKIYSICDPNSYGANWSKYLIEKIKNKDWYFHSVNPKIDKGDAMVAYPTFLTGLEFTNKFYFQNYSKYTSYEVPLPLVHKLFYDIKISYLSNKENSYSIRNIRPYQGLDGYLLTLVDCSNNFDFKFILISHEDLVYRCNLTMTAMNGTSKSNKLNKNVGVGCVFKKGSLSEDLLYRFNMLDGTDFNSVIDYIKKKSDELSKTFKEEFYRDDILINQCKEWKGVCDNKEKIDDDKPPVQTFWLTQAI